jgi:hypothetical protein
MALVALELLDLSHNKIEARAIAAARASAGRRRPRPTRPRARQPAAEVKARGSGPSSPPARRRPPRSQMVPKGVLAGLPRIRTLELSHNALRALPDDVALLTCVCLFGPALVYPHRIDDERARRRAPR